MTEKVISNKICPEKLQSLWQEKEYRNFPVVVLSYVNRDTSVPADARICWYELFNIAYYNSNWCIQISKSELAKMLNKSVPSIERYLSKLKEAGYINIQNVRVRGVWLPSKITVIVPPALLQLLEAAPERKKSSKAKPLKLVVDNTTKYRTNMFHVEPDISQNTAVEPPPPYPQLCSKGILRSDGSKSNINYNKLYTNNNRDIDRSSKENKSSVVIFDRVKKSANCPIEVKQHQEVKSDNLVNQQQIQTLEHKLTPLRQQLKTLSIVNKAKFYNANMLYLDNKLHGLRYSAEIMALADLQYRFNAGLIVKADLRQQQLKTLEAELSLLKFAEPELHYGYMQEDSFTDQTIEKKRLRINAVELEIKQLSMVDKKAVNVKSHDYLHGKGQREFSVELRDWLNAQVEEILGTTDEEKIFEKVNQIAYQVRFGNLQISYKTNQVMSVRHGVNVALMKLREGEWSKPSNMPKAA